MQLTKIIAFLCFFQYSVVFASQQNSTNAIDKLIETNFSNSLFGMVLQDADTGEVLYEKSANTTFIPASAVKLFTAAAALHELTPDFRFKTKILYKKSDLENNTLKSSIAIKFSGDPTLTVRDLENLILNISKANIKTIQGNIILDDSIFNEQHIGDGWSFDDTPWYYASPISAIILNENQINASITSGKSLGSPASVQLKDKSSKYFNVKSSIKTVTEEESETLCQLHIKPEQENNLNINGCWPINKDIATLKFSIPNVKKFTRDFIKDVLAENKILLTGNIVYKTTPANMNVLATHSSLPLKKLLHIMLAESNNVYAEAINKTLGTKLFKDGTFKTGTLAIKKILEGPSGINFDEMELKDGSGLSMYNLITPNQFNKLLYAMYHSPKLKKHYIKSLASTGTKGTTLEFRLKSLKTDENIFAKTGSLHGISTLVGYIKTKTNKNLIFSILINNTTLSRTQVKKIEDELCYLMVKI